MDKAKTAVDSQPKKGKTDEEIKQLALGVYRNEIFTSLQVPQQESLSMLPMIFMPLALMDSKQIKELKNDNPCMFYAFMTDAFPRSVNGYPIFASANYLTEEEFERFRLKLLALMEMEKKI